MIVHQPKIHRKVALIDEYICWERSLNILSQNDGYELMRRLTGKAIADEVLALLKLPKPLSAAPYMAPFPITPRQHDGFAPA